MPKPEPLSDAEYLKEINLLSTEIDNGGIVYHMHEELNHLTLEDEDARDTINMDALFWLAHRHSLQATLFITLGRIFDSDQDNYSIQRLLTATLANIHIFARDALEKRKLSLNPGPRPYWLDDYLNNSWYPSEPNDLRFLKKAIAPYQSRFEAIYRPIRHTIAYRIMTEDEAGEKYFGKTNREEVRKLIDFLSDLVGVLTNLYWNGHKPEHGQRDFAEQNQRIRDGVQSVVRKLVRGRQAA